MNNASFFRCVQLTKRELIVDFYSFLNTAKIVIFDGAMGTELDKRGCLGRCDSNLLHPEAVIDIHREYFRSGSHVAITNTLTMNRIYIETHNLEVKVAEVNRLGAKLAKSAAGNNGYVLGNLSSTGQLLEPYGTYKEIKIYATFKEQASYLLETGVDGFIIETMFDLREALCALRACKEVSTLPVIVSITFHTELDGGRTIMGNSAEECALSLTDEGADVVGTNCGDLDPMQMAKVVSILRSSTSVPILAEPNAGKPKLKDSTTIFDMEPEPFSVGVLECCRAGARIVGGCCGTSPEHIKALSTLMLKEFSSTV